MLKFDNPPVHEMSLAVQFRERAPFSPNSAIRLQSAYATELPLIELHESVATLGGVFEPTLVSVSDALRPRWWFITEDQIDLAQFQDDMIAVNWRNRAKIGQPQVKPYPGFDAMVARLKIAFDRWSAVLGQSVPPVATCSILYDNIWRVAPKEPNSDVYAFWNKIGLTMIRGPDVRLHVAVGDQLPPPARIEVVATRAGMKVDDTSVPIARLTMTGYAYPEKWAEVERVLQILHEHAHDNLVRLTTEKTREAW